MQCISLLLLAASLQRAASISLDVTSPGKTITLTSFMQNPRLMSSTASIRNATSIVSYNLMSKYTNNATGTAATQVGTLPAPLYWWEAGAVWGGMIDYWAYTNDSSNNAAVTQALLAQVGADNNYMPVAYYSSLGNDDQGFWALAVLSALEYGYPTGPSGSPTWLELAENVFNTMVPRWDNGTNGSCGGGLKWQIFSYNAGYDYKNSVSNGAFFQIAARLAHYTGNSTYSDWANVIWDWTTRVGLISPSYMVYDGTSDTQNCTSLDHLQWTYDPALFLYGTAMMYNFTNGTEAQKWANRTTGLLNATAGVFFSPMSNSTNIMYEPSCEPAGTCDDDQYSFKAYLARWMGKTSVVAPFTAGTVQPFLSASALGAAKACTGGSTGMECGQKWYIGGYDGSSGIGQSLSALEVMQALLVSNAPQIRTSANVTIQAAKVVSSASPSATSTQVSSASPSPSKNAEPLTADPRMAALAAVLAGFAAVAAQS